VSALMSAQPGNYSQHVEHLDDHEHPAPAGTPEVDLPLALVRDVAWLLQQRCLHRRCTRRQRRSLRPNAGGGKCQHAAREAPRTHGSDCPSPAGRPRLAHLGGSGARLNLPRGRSHRRDLGRERAARRRLATTALGLVDAEQGAAAVNAGGVAVHVAHLVTAKGAAHDDAG
jgi:hypothetical protein